jgi:hypothetical protein
VRVKEEGMKNPWVAFEGTGYSLMNLGRPAVFLIPSHKLRKQFGEGTVEEVLHRFLLENFAAFTTTTVPYFGFWRGESEKFVYDECRLYEVSFVGAEHIKPLVQKLAEIALAIDEDCFYFKAGEDACLIRPNRS